jgi:hypothetical protein
VTVELGLTLPIPGVDYGNVKPVIRIDGIDPGGDVEAQLASALATSERAFALIDEHMEMAVSRAISPQTDQPTPMDRIAALESQVPQIRRLLNETVKRVKEGALPATVSDKILESITNGDGNLA